MKFLSITLMFVAICNIGCGGGAHVNTATLPDTPQCTYAKDACKEARDYEQSYEKMTREQKEEFKNVLSALRNHCNSALDVCTSGMASDTTKK